MKKFILGLCIFCYGAIGTLITYVYTLMHQCIFNGQEGWLINFRANDTGIPFLFFAAFMLAGILLCVNDFPKNNDDKDDNPQE